MAVDRAYSPRLVPRGAPAGAAAEVPPSATESETAEADPPQEQDMAERYFPQADERMGTRASGLALCAMLIGLAAAIHVIMQARDVH